MIVILFSLMPDIERDFINDLYSKMNVKMYNISFNILRNTFDAEEAVGQTFLKIIDNIEKISNLPCPQIEPYCVIILKNESINIIRKRKKTVHVKDVDYFDHEDGYYNIEEEYLETVNKDILLTCVNNLSDEERNLIHLRFVHDMGFKQIAELLGITEEAAKKRGQRILKKLRLYYEKGDNIVKDC